MEKEENDENIIYIFFCHLASVERKQLHKSNFSISKFE